MNELKNTHTHTHRKHCGAFIRLSTTQQEKRNEPLIHTCMNLKFIFLTKPDQKRLGIVLFHLHDILIKGKQRWNADQWLPEDGGQSLSSKRQHKGIWGVT